MKQIQAVTSTCKIEVEPGVVRLQPIIGKIVDPAKTECWSEMISFRGMIINHVENQFDAGGVQAAYHRFELGDLLAHLSAAGIFCMRSEKPDRVVTPVVG